MTEKTPKIYISRFIILSEDEIKKLTVNEKRQYNQKLKYHTNEEYRTIQNNKCKKRYSKIKEALELHKKLADLKLV